jgi:hypothetical protein
MPSPFARLLGRRAPSRSPAAPPAATRGATTAPAFPDPDPGAWTHGPTPVSSSNLAAVAYSEPRRAMRVWFRNGGVYDYHGVTAYAYAELLDAPSRGRHLHERVKPNYLYIKVG